ncbi:hypothetical protein DR192_06925 [Lawsonia intracellularis]|uniref:hypothetical protein n=1 Tax=Lawsonia intracellularis TaxID=29546 RepID=UPI000DE576EA|nr:hypothetical protein [Lawsonia intracellularis]RBN32747.1 hypothetical protein DR192_06925 [Lawsonia intracellularis]RBN33541.1 hypothetical protein DR193_06925 [Lawsonia intracellularis]
MNKIDKNNTVPQTEVMATSKIIHPSSNKSQRHPLEKNIQHQQKISIEFRSSTGLPLEAPLEISSISLVYRGAILSECHLTENHNTDLLSSKKMHCFDNKLSVDILKYGMLFTNGTISFNVPYRHLNLNELSIIIHYRSQKPVKVDVLVIQNTQEYYFGELAVLKISSWEESHLAFNKNPIHINTSNTQPELLIDNISCINEHNENTLLIHTNEKFCFVIDYTLTNKNLFEQIKLFILLKENTTAHSHTILTQDLKFNPFSPIGKIITPVNFPILPGEYTVTLLLSKKGYYQSKKLPFEKGIPTTEGLYLTYLTYNNISIKVVEQSLEYSSHMAYSLENNEWSIFAYN